MEDRPLQRRKLHSKIGYENRKYIRLLGRVLVFVGLISAIYLFNRSWPLYSLGATVVIIALSVGMSIFMTIQRHLQAQRERKITRPFMLRAIAVDLTGLLLTMTAAILIAGKVGVLAADAAGRAWGATAGLLAALMAGMVVGAGVGLLVRWLWQKVSRPWLARLGQING